MSVSIFLSLSYVDAAFVEAVYARLPRGVARYFQQSFERSEDLIGAMERGLDESQIFVLFASREAIRSYAVAFEIDEARSRLINGKLKKVIVFPIEPGLSFGELPVWLQKSWSPNIGESPADIARYLTTLLLEPDRGLSVGAPKVVGRGASLDRAERLVATHLQRHRANPHIYIFPGISGIGRRTFAAYYLRKALGSEANLPFGPTLTLSAQAELIDLYRALRTEIDPFISAESLGLDQAQFVALDTTDQIVEIVRVMGHFTRLGQAITVVTSAGFFEDAATPKAWVEPLFTAIPPEQLIVVVTNLQFRNEFVDQIGAVVQMRIQELENGDIKALMTFTARSLGLEAFEISDQLVAAIGGHPDVANAAVKLAAQKGMRILERDPRQIFNIQNTIIGDVVRSGELSKSEKLILDVLGWLPFIGADILERIVVDGLGTSHSDFDRAIENLILGCLIYATGYRLSIAPSVRQLYRRDNITDAKTLEQMEAVFSQAWAEAETQGFRDDLFSAFLFMQVSAGKSLPPELRRLLTPGNLHDSVRDAYARGKETDDTAAIEQAIAWGKVALEMTMTDGVREEILSIVVRAQIRLSKWQDAQNIIEFMQKRGYRSVTFLEGHLLRKRRKFNEAIPKLRHVVDNFRHNRAAVHELALCYRRQRQWKELEQLLNEHDRAVSDSPVFVDFKIGLNIARGDLHSVRAAIERLRAMDDNPTRADLREAQLLQKQGKHRAAKEFLTHVMSQGGRSNLRLRALRAFAAAKSGDIRQARDDLGFLKALPNSEPRATNLEAQILLAEERPRAAMDLVQTVTPQEPGDWLLKAVIMDSLADHASTGISEATELRKQATEIRARYGGDPDFLFDD